MAKASDDKFTLELPGLPKATRRGRRATGNAKSGAQRMADLRERRKDQQGRVIRNVEQALALVDGIRDAMLLYGDPALINQETLRQSWADWYSALCKAKRQLEETGVNLAKN